jgi:hypothetical protein
MVTTEEMREFAQDCLQWAEHTRNPSDRGTILCVARRWTDIAAGIERRLHNGDELACPDLKTKLD